VGLGLLVLLKLQLLLDLLEVRVLHHIQWVLVVLGGLEVLRDQQVQSIRGFQLFLSVRQHQKSRLGLEILRDLWDRKLLGNQGDQSILKDQYNRWLLEVR